jgi:hypothetical protein
MALFFKDNWKIRPLHSECRHPLGILRVPYEGQGLTIRPVEGIIWR